MAGFVLLPLLLLGLAELVLRVASYGYSPAFFKPIPIRGEECLVDNDKFGLRFFPPELARSPAPVVIRARKPAGTYRIFVLGESAALGDPRPAYGAARYLQVLLRERFPKVQFEVACGAVTAINSHAVLPIARECARLDGDLWIIFMGNNEMIGPFGATTVFGAQSPPLWYVRLNLAIQRTRLGQALQALARNVAGGASKHGPAWGGMQMFVDNRIASQDRRKDVVYESFQRNLGDMLRAGRAAGVPMILSTVAVNLRDCPPFGSLPGTNLAAAQRAEFEGLSAAAIQAQEHGRFAEAAQGFEQAARIDAHSAELQFRWAQCLMSLSNAAAASTRFQQARDDDALPFRADRRIDQAIRRSAERFAGRDLALCDTVALMASNSPVGIAGEEAFYEHVHFNFDGNYRLARAWAEQAERFLPAATTQGAAPGWASQEICERRLGLTDWNRFAVLEDLLRRLGQAPFTAQAGHAEHVERLRVRLRELRPRVDPAAASQARELYLEALQHAPEDHRLHENFAEFLEATGDLARAAAEWRAVCDLIPQHHVAYFQAGRLLGRQGKLAEGRAQLTRALELRPDLAEGWLELGQLHAREGQSHLAMSAYEREKRLAPRDSRVYYLMGRELSKLKQASAAIEHFRQALGLQPAYVEARYALGEELAFSGQPAAARQEFEAVLQASPGHTMARLNLGVALVQEGRLAEAQGQFEEVLRLDPRNARAQEYLQKLRARRR